MTDNESKLRRKHRIEVVTSERSTKHSLPTFIIENSKPYRKLVFQDSKYRLEISNTSRESSNRQVTVVKVGRRRHYKRNSKSNQVKVKLKEEASLKELNSEGEAKASGGFAWKKVVDKGVAAAGKLFKSQKTDKLPLLSRKEKKERNPVTLLTNKMSSETNAVSDQLKEENKEDKQDPNKVRVVSDHVSATKAAESNNNKVKTGLTVPDDSDKKRRSMETLTAEMHFEDEEEQ